MLIRKRSYHFFLKLLVSSGSKSKSSSEFCISNSSAIFGAEVVVLICGFGGALSLAAVAAADADAEEEAEEEEEEELANEVLCFDILLYSFMVIVFLICSATFSATRRSFSAPWISRYIAIRFWVESRIFLMLYLK